MPADSRRGDLPQCGELTPADARAVRRDHEAWLENNCYINMDLLRELPKEQLRKDA
jgi:hypothetical protein